MSFDTERFARSYYKCDRDCTMHDYHLRSARQIIADYEASVTRRPEARGMNPRVKGTTALWMAVAWVVGMGVAWGVAAALAAAVTFALGAAFASFAAEAAIDESRDERLRTCLRTRATVVR